MNDDELIARIRAARPDSGRAGAPLSTRAQRDLARLLETAEDREATASASPQRKKASRHRWPLPLAAASVTAFLAVALASFGIDNTIDAATPHRLDIDPIDADTAQLLTDAAHNAAERTTAPDSPNEPVSYQAWARNLGFDEEDGLHSPLAPSQRVSVTHDGHEASVTTRVPVPLDPDEAGSPESTPGAGAREVVTEHVVPVPTPEPPRTPNAWAAFLERHAEVSPQAAAGEVLKNLPLILNFWALDPGQESALIEHLSTLEDIEAAGSTTDRLGRDAIVFVASPDSTDWQHKLLVGRNDGRILAVETLYVGSSRADLPSPAVTEYTVWEHD